MVFDVDTLLAELPGEHPAGVNLRQSDSTPNPYYRLKDARSAARVAERAADADPERGSLAPEWRLIFEQAQVLLAEQSKDLEVACWLAEAAIRLHGFAGLRDAMAVLDGLVEHFWTELHSVDDEDVGAKVAPVAGLNGLGADGALIQPIRLAPITAPAGPGPAGLWHYMVLRRRGPASPEAVQLAGCVTATDRATFVAIHRDIAAALASFAALTARLDALCGEETPPSSTIRNTLQEAQDALREVSGLDAATLAAEPAGVAAPETEPAEAAPVAAAPAASNAAQAGPTRLETREDALRELARIAAFFREHEPNSPTAYTLLTLIRRARLPLAELLAELIPDETVRRSYLNLSGIGPDVPEK